MFTVRVPSSLWVLLERVALARGITFDALVEEILSGPTLAELVTC